MSKYKTMTFVLMTFLLPIISIFGCSGGSGSSGNSDPPSTTVNGGSALEVVPSTHDFGIVTFGNMPAPLKIKITNIGSTDINIHDVSLSDTGNYELHLDGESNSCDTLSPTLAVGETCTMEVEFHPSEFGSFDAVLAVTPGDPSTPPANVQLSGAYEAESKLNVRINQVATDANCPAPEITAYVSITDQGGYPVKNLSETNFSIFENMDQVALSRAPSFVSQVYAPISIALAMDYSRSITDTQEYVDDMEEAVADFLHQIGPVDEAEIIKFGTEVEVLQKFTSDKTLLIDALHSPWDKGGKTNLYDAVWQAVHDAAERPNARKAVIVITDGENRGKQTKYSLDTIIQYANTKGIPVFTIGLGLFDSSILEKISDGTGGQFYSATTSDNLRNTYQQLIDTLFENQYILSYVSGLAAGVAGDLNIKVISQAASGEDIKKILPCP